MKIRRKAWALGRYIKADEGLEWKWEDGEVFRSIPEFFECNDWELFYDLP